MKSGKFFLILICLVTLISFSSAALPNDAKNVIDFIYEVPINYSNIVINLSANNTEYLQGYTPDTLYNYFEGLFNDVYCRLTGCTMEGDIDMNNNSISNVETLDFNEGYSITGSESVGSMYYNELEGYYEIRMNDEVTLSINGGAFYGKAMGNIYNGDVVMYAGVQGDHPLIKKANVTEINLLPHLLLGIATEDILNNEFGYVTYVGLVNDIYTYNWSAGDILYFNWSDGGLTNVRPVAPYRVISFAIVQQEQTGAAQNGKIYVRPTIGQNLGDISDVNNNCSNGQVLVKNTTSGIWECSDNVTILDGYIYGQPLDGSLGSGIIWIDGTSEFSELVVTCDGLNCSYNSFKVRLVNTSNYVKYCEITAGSVMLTDNQHNVVYVDMDCNINTISAQEYVLTPTSPGGQADFMNIIAYNGQTENINGLGLENKRQIKLRKLLLRSSGKHLDVVSGLNYQTNGFPEFNITSGEYVYLYDIVQTTDQSTLINGTEIVYHTDINTWEHDEQIGLNLTTCDTGTGITTCSDINRYRRHFIFMIGNNDSGIDETHIHQLLPLENVNYATLADCLDTETNPLTYVIPDYYEYGAVMLYAYCGRASDTAWVNTNFIDMRTVKTGSASATPEGVFLKVDGSEPLTANWNYGSYNINGSGNITTTGIIASEENLTVGNNTEWVSIARNTTSSTFQSESGDMRFSLNNGSSQNDVMILSEGRSVTIDAGKRSFAGSDDFILKASGEATGIGIIASIMDFQFTHSSTQSYALTTYNRVSKTNNMSSGTGAIEGIRQVLGSSGVFADGQTATITGIDNREVYPFDVANDGTSNTYLYKGNIESIIRVNSNNGTMKKYGLSLNDEGILNIDGYLNLTRYGISLTGWGTNILAFGGAITESGGAIYSDSGNLILDHNSDLGEIILGDNQESHIGFDGTNIYVNMTNDGAFTVYNTTGLGKIRALEYATSTPKDLEYTSSNERYIDSLPSPDNLLDSDGKIKAGAFKQAQTTYLETDYNNCSEVGIGEFWYCYDILIEKTKKEICFSNKTDITKDVMKLLSNERYKEKTKIVCGKKEVNVTLVDTQAFENTLMISELKEENTLLKSELCSKDSSYSWCKEEIIK